MNFNDINFYERNAGKSELGRHLRGYWVPKRFFDIAWRHALVEMPKLDWHVPQTTETLCGTAGWQLKSFGERFRLGRCMKFFVDQKMLPLKVANPGKKGKRTYARATF